MNIDKDKIESFVTIPRFIADAYRNGQLKRHERQLLEWLRQEANAYGIAKVSLESLTADVFGNVDKSYTNRFLLSLKSKGFIWFERRSGRRGSFNVQMDWWILPRKSKADLIKIYRIDKKSNISNIVSEFDIGTIFDQSDVSSQSESTGQRLKEIESGLTALDNAFSIKSKVSASYNDTDTYKEKDTNRSRTIKERKNIKVDTFVPKSDEEEECWRIATELGESTMDFMLGSLYKHGIIHLRRAWEECKQSKSYNAAENKGAFFNSVLQQQIVSS